jgi:acyl carrier protein
MQPHTTLVRDLSALFRDKLFIDVPSADTDLIDSGLLDSLQLVQLLLHVERDLGYRIPLDEIDLDDLRSLERLARVIAARAALASA